MVRSIVVITDIDEGAVQNLRKTAQEKSINAEDFVESILGRYVGDENIDGVLIKKDKYLKIAFNEIGRKRLDDLSAKEGISLSGVINYIFSKEGF